MPMRTKSINSIVGAEGAKENYSMEKEKTTKDLEEILNPDYGNWEVKDDGSIIYHGNEISIEEIPVDRLTFGHLTHMLGKFRGISSKDAADFYFAYLQALKNAGYKSLSIDLKNIHDLKFIGYEEI